MKAIVRYKDEKGTRRQKTIVVNNNEPNDILTNFLKATRLPRYTWVTTIKCGRYEYQWNGVAKEAWWR